MQYVFLFIVLLHYLKKTLLKIKKDTFADLH